ncbi:MAG: lipid A deacylase LpxR family protein [Rhodospirillaceae bacterium]
MKRAQYLSTTFVAFFSIFSSAEAATVCPHVEGGRTIGVWWDNDMFSGTDRYYTNGMQAYYVTAPSEPTVRNRLAPVLSVPEGCVSERYGFALGQKMFTPGDISRPIPSLDDRPYAGWLFGRVSLQSEAPKVVEQFALDLGVVGPASGAAETQQFVHKRVPGAIYPRGWAYQLQNEPGVVLSYDRLWRNEEEQKGFGYDIIPHVSASVGNIYTFGGAGATLRLGWDLPPAVGVPVASSRTVTPIPYQDATGHGFVWYLFASAEGRLVARDIFLDGNSFRDSRSVTKIPVVGALETGATFHLSGKVGGYDPGINLTLAHVLMSPTFTTQKGASRYWTARLAVTF